MSTVAEIEAAIEKLPAVEQRELARWLGERLLQEESPEMLATLDEGIRSFEEKGAVNTHAPSSNGKYGDGLACRPNRTR
jgi:hypothetical protein